MKNPMFHVQLLSDHNRKPENDFICCPNTKLDTTGLTAFRVVFGVSLEGKKVAHGTPLMLALNCNSSRLAVVDMQGVLNILDLTGNMVRR